MLLKVQLCRNIHVFFLAQYSFFLHSNKSSSQGLLSPTAPDLDWIVALIEKGFLISAMEM